MRLEVAHNSEARFAEPQIQGSVQPCLLPRRASRVTVGCEARGNAQGRPAIGQHRLLEKIGKKPDPWSGSGEELEVLIDAA